MAKAPKPFTPPNCDLRGLPFMPLLGDRLVDSDLFFRTTGDEFKAALALWWASWKQVPAASLPDDERVLAGLARIPDLRKWQKVAEGAMRGWVKCADGRLYHRVVADLALDAWEERQEHRAKTESETERKRREREERRAMFAGLKAIGVHLAWNTPLADLRRAAEEKGVKPVTDLSAGQAADIPGLEGTGTGTGTGNLREEGSDEPSLSGAGKPTRARASRRPPEVPLPDGYPDDAAIAEAEVWAREAGVVLDATAQARRFSHHAATKDRRERNWPAAWRQWIGIACESAPANNAQAARSTATVTWLGPRDLWIAVAASRPEGQGEGFAISWLAPCTWRPEQRELVTDSPLVARKLQEECSALLAAADVRLRLETGRAA